MSPPSLPQPPNPHATGVHLQSSWGRERYGAVGVGEVVLRMGRIMGASAAAVQQWAAGDTTGLITGAMGLGPRLPAILLVSSGQTG